MLHAQWKLKRVGKALVRYCELEDGVEFQARPHGGLLVGTAFVDEEAVASTLAATLARVEEGLRRELLGNLAEGVENALSAVIDLGP